MQNRIHGISTELAQEQGIPLEECLALFNECVAKNQVYCWSEC